MMSKANRNTLSDTSLRIPAMHCRCWSSLGTYVFTGEVYIEGFVPHPLWPRILSAKILGNFNRFCIIFTAPFGIKSTEPVKNLEVEPLSFFSENIFNSCGGRLVASLPFYPSTVHMYASGQKATVTTFHYSHKIENGTIYQKKEWFFTNSNNSRVAIIGKTD